MGSTSVQTHPYAAEQENNLKLPCSITEVKDSWGVITT